ncbi:unnamed protein product [Amoebophrya sp. A25]|nr:unnamed protein product [Amoebophrya sp. A25]|eukprot:GSA25T00017004001.1
MAEANSTQTACAMLEEADTFRLLHTTHVWFIELFQASSFDKMGNIMCCKKRPGIIQGDVKDGAAFANAKGMLASAQTKVGSGAADPQAVKHMQQLYDQVGGDLNQLASKTGANLAALKKKPPTGSKDFATNLLQGAYS